MRITQIAVVDWNPIYLTQIYHTSHFLSRNERLVPLFSMPGSNNPSSIAAAKYDPQRLGKVTDRASRRLLYKDIALHTILVRKKHQINRFLQRHKKTSHRRISYGDRLAFLKLLHEE